MTDQITLNVPVCTTCKNSAADKVLLATAEHPEAGVYTEEVFTCQDCRSRNVVRASLPRSEELNWKLQEPVDFVQCPTCKRVIHPSRLCACGEPDCTVHGCTSCTGIHYDIGACSVCINFEHWAAHEDADVLHPTHVKDERGFTVQNAVHREYVAQRVDERLTYLKTVCKGG